MDLKGLSFLLLKYYGLLVTLFNCLYEGKRKTVKCSVSDSLNYSEICTVKAVKCHTITSLIWEQNFTMDSTWASSALSVFSSPSSSFTPDSLTSAPQWLLTLSKSENFQMVLTLSHCSLHYFINQRKPLRHMASLLENRKECSRDVILSLMKKWVDCWCKRDDWQLEQLNI